MQRCFPARLLDLLLCRVKLGHSDIAGDRILKHLGLLRHIALHFPQVGGVDLIDIDRYCFAGTIRGCLRVVRVIRILPHDRDPAFLHLPETHQELEQCGLAASALSHDADDLILRYAQREIAQDRRYAAAVFGLLTSVAKGDHLALCAAEFHFLMAGDLLCLGLFLDDRQNTGTGSCRVLQRRAKACQRRHRPKGGKHGQNRQQESVEADFSVQVQQSRCDRHQYVKNQNERICDRKIEACQAVERTLVPLQRLGLFAHCGHSLLAAAVLDRLVQSADILKDAGGKFRGLLPHFLSHIAADRRNNERHRDTHAQIGGERQDPKPDVE